MTTKQHKIRVFVPGPSSRFYPDLKSSFALNGIDISSNKRSLRKELGDIEFIFARGFDIPHFIKDGWGHAGITGLDALVEAGFGVDILSHLGVRQSQVVFASSQINSINELKEGDVVVSEYRKIGPQFLKNRGIDGIRFRYVTGGVESIAHFPQVKGIFTLVTSGQSLQDNNIKLLSSVLNTHACFITNKNLKQDEMQRISDLINQLPVYDFKEQDHELGSFRIKQIELNRLKNTSFTH
jgi:ATP phosphoribosyltransferase